MQLGDLAKHANTEHFSCPNKCYCSACEKEKKKIEGNALKLAAFRMTTLKFYSGDVTKSPGFLPNLQKLYQMTFEQLSDLKLTNIHYNHDNGSYLYSLAFEFLDGTLSPP